MIKKFLIYIILTCASLESTNYSYSELLKGSEPEQKVALQEVRTFFGLNENTQYSSSLKSVQDYLREGIVVDLNTAPKSAVKSYALSFYKAYLKFSTITRKKLPPLK